VVPGPERGGPVNAAPAVAVRSVRQFHLPTPGAEPFDIAAGPGGSMWFTEYNTTRIGRVSRSGRVTEFRLPRPTLGGDGITGTPRGPVWVADPAGYIDRVTPAGMVTRTTLPAGAIPFAITMTQLGTVWFSELTRYFEYSRVLRSLDGQPGLAAGALTLASRTSNMDALATGPAGTVWFTDFGNSQIGELGPGRRLRLFGDRAPYGGLSDITRGPDGAMWFTEQAGLVGRITPAGAVSALALPSRGTNPDGIAAGPGRTVWVTETGKDIVARITLPAPAR